MRCKGDCKLGKFHPAPKSFTGSTLIQNPKDNVFHIISMWLAVFIRLSLHPAHEISCGRPARRHPSSEQEERIRGRINVQ